MRKNGNILIFASSRTAQLIAGIELVKENFSPEKIILLTQYGKEYSALKWDYDTFNVEGDGHFNLFKIKGKIIRRINKLSIDHVVILYNNKDGIDCFNLDLVAFFIKGKTWIYDVSSNFYPLLSCRYLFKILLKRSISYLFQKIMQISFLPLLLLLSLFNKLLKIENSSFEKQKGFGG